MQFKAILLASAVAVAAGMGCASTPGAADADATGVADARGVCAGPRQRTTGSRIPTSCPQGRVGTAEGMRETPVGVGEQADGNR